MTVVSGGFNLKSQVFSGALRELTSSLRCENDLGDVCRTRTVLRMLWRTKKYSFSFVLHQEFFCLKDVVVDLKVPDISNERGWPPILLGLD